MAEGGEAPTQANAPSWEEYFRLTQAGPPKPMMLRALPYVAAKGHALDLGAGALNETRHLLKEGFRVAALDATAPSETLSSVSNTERFAFIHQRMEDFAFPQAEYDLVNAMFSLPFLAPEVFPVVFEKVCLSLRPGGVFVGQLFGQDDEWAGDPGMTFHDADEARRLLGRHAEFIYFCDEENWDGRVANGATKRWHILHFIVRRRAD